MTFRRSKNLAGLGIAAVGFATFLFGAAGAADSQLGYAVVPTTTIYPGEEISAARIEELEVTNPNLRGDYARSASEVIGLVAKRTLLPGRTISVSTLRDPYAMTRGSTVRLVFTYGAMVISASGTPLADASVGDVIKARNLDSGVIISGTVMADGTLHVVAK